MSWLKKLLRGSSKTSPVNDFVPIEERKILMSGKELKSIQDKLPLPIQLVEMMEKGEWVHPGDAVIKKKIPFVDCVVDILTTKEEMLTESWGILMEDENEREFISAYRGSFAAAKDLPWLDVEKSVAIMVNREIGDDHVILLDFRNDLSNPRVVGSDWTTIPRRMIYREIAPSFDAFLEMLYD